jgi:hypothetical protein
MRCRCSFARSVTSDCTSNGDPELPAADAAFFLPWRECRHSIWDRTSTIPKKPGSSRQGRFVFYRFHARHRPAIQGVREGDKHDADAPKPCCVPENPRGAEAASYDPGQPNIRIPRKVIKGGSHLRAPNYCRRYRPAARHAEAVDTSTSHLGFGCVKRTPAAQKIASPQAAGSGFRGAGIRIRIAERQRTAKAVVGGGARRDPER